MSNPTPATPVAGTMPSATTPTPNTKPETQAAKIDPAAKPEPVVAAKV